METTSDVNVRIWRFLLSYWYVFTFYISFINQPKRSVVSVWTLPSHLIVSPFSCHNTNRPCNIFKSCYKMATLFSFFVCLFDWFLLLTDSHKRNHLQLWPEHPHQHHAGWLRLVHFLPQHNPLHVLPDKVRNHFVCRYLQWKCRICVHKNKLLHFPKKRADFSVILKWLASWVASTLFSKN